MHAAAVAAQTCMQTCQYLLFHRRDIVRRHCYHPARQPRRSYQKRNDDDRDGGRLSAESPSQERCCPSRTGAWCAWLVLFIIVSFPVVITPHLQNYSIVPACHAGMHACMARDLRDSRMHVHSYGCSLSLKKDIYKNRVCWRCHGWMVISLHNTLAINNVLCPACLCMTLV